MNARIWVVARMNGAKEHEVAPPWHTLGLLLILALITYGGVHSHGTNTQSAEPTNLVKLYVTVMAGEWALVFYVWRGVRRRGGALRDLIGRDFSGMREFSRLIATAVVFWFVWEGAARAMHVLLGRGEMPNVAAMLPHTPVQIVLWCTVSCTAGFCEEIVYRGYLQRQFAAWTGSAAAAIALQAVIFGASHAYQGMKQVLVIGVLGALYGVLAQWMRTLVPGMAAHAWSDIYGGWLRP